MCFLSRGFFNFTNAVPSTTLKGKKLTSDLSFRCPHLRCLNLRTNKFTSIPSTVLQLPSLEILDMSRNRLRAIPNDIRRLSSLKVLDVQDNNIQGLPIALGTMSNLLTLNYNKNPIVFPSEEDVRSYRCEPDFDMGKDSPVPEIRQLKEYLKNHSSQISERDGKF